MSTERDDQRQQKRTPQPGVPIEPFAAKDPTPRAIPKCDDVPVTTPREFFTPEGCPPPAPPAELLPDPLVFRNLTTTRRCSDVPSVGPVGVDVTIPANQFLSRLYFQELPDITTAQLSLIANQPPAVIQLMANPTTPASEVGQRLRLDAHQALAFSERRAAAIAEVASLAVTAALGQLVCAWENTLQIANCAPGALTNDSVSDAQAANVNNPVTVPAGTVTSTDSQDAANLQALTLAQAALNCLWANTEQVADCVTDLDFTEAIPNDETTVGVATRLRVGSVAIPAGTLFSDVSQEDADNQAKALAVGNLVCFYVNPVVIVTCPADIDNVPATIAPTDAVSGTVGSPVTVPAGYVESDSNTAAATAEAEALGLSLLNCFWLSDEQTVVCPPQGPDDAYFPSPASPVSTVTVAAGEVTSLISKADANEQARFQATLQLDCRYCSLEVPPRCIPPDYTVTVLPIPLGEVTDSWSLDATLGAPAGLFCSPDWESAQAAASSIANIPIPPAAPPGDCTYGNAPIEAQCIGDPTAGVVVIPTVANPRARGGPCFGGQTGTASSPYILPLSEPADGIIRVALFDTAAGARLSSQSYPNPFADNPEARKVRVAQNAFTVSAGLVPADYAPSDPNRARLYANELAAVLALSSLNCFFSNCAGYYLCHGRINAGTYDPPLVGSYLDVPVYGTGAAEATVGIPTEFPVAPAAYGSTTNPVYVQEGQFVSYTSYAEVASGLNAFLRGTLDCYWTNPERTIYCGAHLDTTPGATAFTFSPGTGEVNGQFVHPKNEAAESYGVDFSVGAVVNPVKVEAGLYFNYQHPNLADLQAIQLGLAQLDCFFVNDTISVGCGSFEDNELRVPSRLAPGSVGSVVAPAGIYFSKFSQLNADAIARTAARSQLLCIYENEPVSGTKACPPGQTPSGPTSLPAGYVTSMVGTNNANNTARTMLKSLQNCSTPGEPGNDGAQAGCAGNCFGYYS